MSINKVKRGESETKLRLRRTVSAANFGNAARAARRGYTTIEDDEGKISYILKSGLEYFLSESRL